MITASSVILFTLRKMIEYLIFCLICIGLVYTFLENAPEGYEDAQGFHYGKEPKKPLDKE